MDWLSKSLQRIEHLWRVRIGLTLRISRVRLSGGTKKEEDFCGPVSLVRTMSGYSLVTTSGIITIVKKIIFFKLLAEL